MRERTMELRMPPTTAFFLHMVSCGPATNRHNLRRCPCLNRGFTKTGFASTAALRKPNRHRARNHHQRSRDHQHSCRYALPRQLSKHQRSPREAPELIRIRERNTAADPEILRRVLLEQVSQNPAEAA